MYDKHPIQILGIDYLKLYLEKNPASEQDELEQGNFQIQSMHSDLNEDTSEIWVKVRCLIGYDDDANKEKDASFWLEVELEAAFEVDTEKFSPKSLPHWAQTNATIVLYPYIREAVASLSGRLFNKDHVVLPLLTVPTT
ncbi:protein-export chaperone SecB [Vibrio cholerae]|uniref:protein-export chaperone SecB n=1 Tax=Vibrio cholerae TaxID=666 RepID=UPI00115AFD68|nr:protein-export chaperone SecB [Vibrio cholerae]MDV2313028.1 protein-export chaperone SecB [Vibrio cholerae]MDV2335507.1 protein-export chaperone SecB [Vibrio cholerae]TQQ33912.1 protein-export chaperone SecB [Vibrio cholerae]